MLKDYYTFSRTDMLKDCSTCSVELTCKRIVVVELLLLHVKDCSSSSVELCTYTKRSEPSAARILSSSLSLNTSLTQGFPLALVTMPTTGFRGLPPLS